MSSTHPECKEVIKEAWKANRLIGWVGSGEIGYIWVKKLIINQIKVGNLAPKKKKKKD